MAIPSITGWLTPLDDRLGITIAVTKVMQCQLASCLSSLRRCIIKVVIFMACQSSGIDSKA